MQKFKEYRLGSSLTKDIGLELIQKSVRLMPLKGVFYVFVKIKISAISALSAGHKVKKSKRQFIINN